MAGGTSFHLRVQVDGKFFRLGDKKFYVKGVSYGPFAPNDELERFPARERTALDLGLIRHLGATTVRVYEVPPRWFLDLASTHELKVLVDCPWHKERCFLDSPGWRKEAREAVRQTVRAGRGHPAVFGYTVVNEVPADVVRWSGAQRTVEFIEELIDVAKTVDAEALCSMANFPPTEFLRPQNADFICFNLYLHNRRSYESYLARLQMQADDKPLVLGEIGIDSLREGEGRKTEILGWQIESAFRAGLAGVTIFSFTDDWHRNGLQVEDWAMGLTTARREPKESFAMVQKRFLEAPHFPLSLSPRVSVVVACYNGGRTLKPCLDALGRLNYPDYEVILVDDGSTDATPDIASLYQNIRYLRQPNHGLSVARNTGIEASTGEIVAFTDADCRVDEDWLYYLVGDLTTSRFAGMGGPNFLPTEDSAVAAAVMVSPGGPAHVMITDREAEHIPGCNMAFYKWALEEIGAFDPVFRKAGDDVDVCWRLQQRGYRIGFCAGAFVWHHRRSNVRAYLSQQEGYGEAEALLVRKHPEYFNALGASMWRGRIYSAAQLGVHARRPIIYHGVFGTGTFQAIYAGEPAAGLLFCTSLEYHVLITLPLLVLSVPFPWLWPLGLTSFLISVGVCLAAAAQARIAKNRRRWWTRLLVGLLFFLQPIVRGWARYHGRLGRQPTPRIAPRPALAGKRDKSLQALGEVYYWSERPLSRVQFVYSIQEKLDRQGWTSKSDTGWNEYDIEIYGRRWSWLQLLTVTEDVTGGKRIFRCRLRTGWSLPAKLLFWSAFAIELLIVGVLARREPWLWMMLLSMPLLGAYLEEERRNLEELVASFLDELAAELQLHRLHFDKKEESFAPVTAVASESVVR